METSKLLAQDLRDSKYGYMSVSWGTLRSQDLLPAYFGVFNTYRNPEDQEAENLSKEIESQLANVVLEDRFADFWDSDQCMDIMTALEDALEAICPEGYYFGTSAGDASDFGFWPVPEEE